MDDAALIGSAAYNSRFYTIMRAKPRIHAVDFSIFIKSHCYNLILLEPQIFLMLQHRFHIGMIGAPIALHAQTVHRWSFSHIEHSALQKSSVRRFCHLSAQGVNLTHKMSLRRASD